jgi:hypothetical protein
MPDLSLADLPKLKGKSLIATFDINAKGDLVIFLHEVTNIAPVNSLNPNEVMGTLGAQLEPLTISKMFLNMVKPFMGMVGKGGKK